MIGCLGKQAFPYLGGSFYRRGSGAFFLLLVFQEGKVTIIAWEEKTQLHHRFDSDQIHPPRPHLYHLET